VGIVLNPHYSIATKVNLYFDDDPAPVTLTTQPNGERQDFDLTPRQAERLTLELAEFNKPGETTGIDNLWLHVVRSEDWRARVKPLLNVGGLMKYPMGQGGLVLNQLNVRDTEPVPDNAQKKRNIVATLLRNLHATFAGGQVLTTAALEFQPLPLDVQCNQYLTQDRGWYEGGRDLSALPHGEVQLDGVLYSIRDFKTSPVPSCVMLAGPGARGQLPNEVRGLTVNTRADALFFLHTLNRSQDWRSGRPEDTPPVVFRYVVNYADGQSVEVPILYGEGVDHWIAREPAGLKGASVAWSAPFPGDASGDQAVLYQLQWQNPRPEVTVASVDLLYGPEGGRWGAPALIALTAGRSRAGQ
jgi:beta-galactosidase